MPLLSGFGMKSGEKSRGIEKTLQVYLLKNIFYIEKKNIYHRLGDFPITVGSFLIVIWYMVIEPQIFKEDVFWLYVFGIVLIPVPFEVYIVRYKRYKVLLQSIFFGNSVMELY